MEDTLKGHQRAKLERYGDKTFLVLQPARYLDASETVEFGEVHLFLGPDFVITVRHAENPDLGAVRRRLEGSPATLAQGPYAVAWAICDDVVDQYAPVVAGLENDIDEIEDELFSGDAECLQAHLRPAARGDRPAARDGAAGRDVRPDAGRSSRGPPEAEAPAFRDVDDHARRVVDKVDTFRQTLGSALTVHATLVEQQSNEEMRRMTEFGLQQNEQVKKVSGWAAILFAPTLVGTVYGMNFDNMPELHWTYGYYVALLLMAATSVTLYLVFKRKGWL